MLKIFLLAVSCCVILSHESNAQFTYKIKADSVLITNDSCTAELILENSTKIVKGFLYNKGNGRTEFRAAMVRVNDTTYIIGGDSLKLSSGSSRDWKLGGNTGITNANDFFGTTDNRVVAIRTNNIERMRFNWHNGFVGIGTTAPVQPLHLGGTNPTIYLEGDNNSYYPAILFKSALGTGKLDLYGPGGYTGLFLTVPSVNNKSMAIGVTADCPTAMTQDSSKRALRVFGAQNQVAHLFQISQNIHTLPGAVWEKPVFTVNKDGKVSIGDFSSSAMLHVQAGTATANTAPIKLTAGTNLTTPEAGAIEFDGTNYYATSGSTRYTLAKTLTATATLDFGNTAAQTSSDLTITVNGVGDGDAVSIGIPNASRNANSSFEAWVSTANTVTVRFNNYSSGSINPTSGSFRVAVTKY
ncbi:hypothetical protein LZZ85_05615 [Terrimonas sp. NA20]|uniref:Uncharacterized protein n=1 Tax=Terrimonas ginsenosidimutans TaxID=2908004 RepID=A0ABS9KN31_9BACT|nr:hypothetical protein [Terrimonas ginsenosidimutans]MCG2613745.1 hypothetical protein [Terrimonas ginsenosidimutans]